jgi:tRNA(Ile)-lysidine synthase TilS/MesJ
MRCSTCKSAAIIYQPYSGRHLCGDHFILDLEAKAKRAIRMHHWLQPDDQIAVILNGDFASNALLFFLRKLTGKRKDIRISAVTGDGGLSSYNTSRESGITKIAVATTLEDAAASTLTRILEGDMEKCFKPSSTSEKRIPVIKPFRHIPDEEIAAYARLCGVDGDTRTRVIENNRLFTDVKAMLTDYSSRHPGAPHAVLNLCESLTRSYRNTMEETCGSS